MTHRTLAGSGSRTRTPTTRLAFSEEHRLAIRAEDGFHGRADLVKRAVRAGAIENERHQVLVCRGGGAQVGEPTIHYGVVAGRSHLRHSVTLLALGLLRDLKQLNFKCWIIGYEIIHANDDATVLLDLPLLAGRGLVDLPLEPPGLQATHDSANILDLPEQRLRLALELGRQRLDVMRS